MRQVINDFKAIWADKKERTEFFGSLACVLVALLGLYLTSVVLG